MSQPYFNVIHTNTAAINTSVAITLAAIPGSSRMIKQVSWSHDGDPAAVTRLTIESPASTVLQDLDITKGGPGFILYPEPGIHGASGQALIVKLTVAATSNTTATLNVIEGNA